MVVSEDGSLERWDSDGAGRVMGTTWENLIAHLALLLAFVVALLSLVLLCFMLNRVRMSKDISMVRRVEMPGLLDLFEGHIEILGQFVVKFRAAGHQTVLEVTDLALNASQEIGRVDALGGQVFALDKSLVGVVEETLDLMVVEGLRMRLNELICYLHVSDGEVEHAEN